ncbi:SKP1 component POZ domain-containing protein [Plasmodiophora brassicae]
MSNGNRGHRIIGSWSGLLLTVVLAVGITDAATLISEDGAEFVIDDVTPLAQHSRTIQRMTEDVFNVGIVPLPIIGNHLRLIVEFVTSHFPLENYRVGSAAKWVFKRLHQIMGSDPAMVDQFVQALDYLQMHSLPVAMGWMLRQNPDWLGCSTNRPAFRERPDAYRLIAGPIRLYHLAKKLRHKIREAEDICNLVVSGGNASHIDARRWRYRGNVLHNAAHDGEEFVVEMLLLLTGFNINAQAHEYQGQTALHYAAHGGDSAIVRLLLQQPAVEVNTMGDGNCYAPLHLASTVDVVRELLKHPGINVNIASTDQGQWTPLILAAQYGRDDIVQELLTAPTIRVNQPSGDSFWSNRWTALHWAADHRHINVVQLLVTDPRTEINPRDSLGRTPLTLAVYKGSWAVACMLLDHGAIV